SVLEEVVVELERLGLVGIAGGLGAADLQVFSREPGPQRGHQDRVLLELVERLGRCQREAPDAASLTLLIGQVARVLADWLARIEAALDAVEDRGDDAAQREIR